MEWAHDLAQTMRNSALAGDLRLRHPKTLFPADPEAVLNDDWGYLVCTRDDLNAWLEAAGYPVRVPSAGAQQEAPRESVALVSPRSLGEKWTHEHRAELMRQHKALSDRGHKFAQADEMIAEAWNTSPSSIKQQRLASKKGV